MRRSLTPEAREVLRTVNGGGGVRTHRAPRTASRRGLLLGAAGLGVLAAGGGTIAALRSRDTAAPTFTCLARDVSETEKTLVFNNWPLYIDLTEDERSRPTLEAFQERSGIAVTYKEEINDNVEFMAGLTPKLAACAPSDDIVVLTDWASAQLIRDGYAQRLDLARLKNVEANLLPNLRIRSWDRDRRYAVPWQSGLSGIAYHGGEVRPVRTVEELLTRSDLKGRVTLLSDMRDTIGLIMQSLGYNASDFSESHFEEAIEVLDSAVEAGQIVAFTGNEYAEDLGNGDVAACMAWSGDVVQLQFDNDAIQFVAPETGSMLFSDNMQVPVTSAHLDNALNLMNYYYEPAVAAEVAAYVNYICPVAGAQAEMEKIDPDLAANPLIFPDPDTLATTRIFMALEPDEEARYRARWDQVVAKVSDK
ncbi:ABC transporter substrate-binding protein [Catenuloplanes atrovinosus]|uniref:Spermidine/putrescine transport system substrate-binding protein n=1 Tax=Catenuloplanes atrovinosus TaxID=137266 RepID=A0AAE3YVN4_9ACTN|nr:spermidine/putrescine ABC transporter substrate-binding protein [Catenuloplanes atrovinosus]MDR7279204.1 spermidine/putrescine transport system substrate-binding protein [Catenuloplanes atrovinosus]